MDIRQLRYFVAIVEAGSFSRAAQLLNIAQPALSLHVRNMETDLGVDLLLRTPQGVSPTDAGRLLLDRARRLLADFDATRQAVRDFESDPAGEVHLVRPLARSLGSAADAVHRLCRETLQHLIAEGRWLTDLDDPGQAHRPAPPKGA